MGGFPANSNFLSGVVLYLVEPFGCDLGFGSGFGFRFDLFDYFGGEEHWERGALGITTKKK